jgi:hypothetical protein
LTASVSPDSVLSRWEWYVQKPGDDAAMLVESQHGAELSFAATTEFDGAAVFARLTFEDGRSYVEAPPVLLKVVEDGDDPGTGGPQEPQKPTEAPQQRTGDELDGAAETGFGLSGTTLTQGQIITLQLGEDYAGQWTAAWLFSTPTLLGGDWTQANTAGAIVVRVPLDAAPGEHRLAVFAADGTVIGWTTVDIVAATGEAPVGALPATGGSLSPLWIGGGILFVTAGAAAVLIGRRRAATARH